MSKVSFHYSAAYDHMLTMMMMQQFDESQVARVKKFTYELDAWWASEEGRVIKEIEKVSGLKFPKAVECYVVNQMLYTAISHPLTIKMDASFERLKLVLVHELIHVLLASHAECKEMVLNLNERYPDKDTYFKSHIPVFLVQAKVLENLYGKNAMKNYIAQDVLEEELPIVREAERLGKQFDRNVVKFFQ